MSVTSGSRMTPGGLACIPGWMVMSLTEERNPRKDKTEGRGSGGQIMNLSWNLRIGSKCLESRGNI